MAKKKAVENIGMEIKDLLKKGKLVIGAGKVADSLKHDKLERVYMASNCNDVIRSDIEHYCKIGNVEIVQLKYPNEELGDVCKKPFSISVLGVVKSK